MSMHEYQSRMDANNRKLVQKQRELDNMVRLNEQLLTDKDTLRRSLVIRDKEIDHMTSQIRNHQLTISQQYDDIEKSTNKVEALETELGYAKDNITIVCETLKQEREKIGDLHNEVRRYKREAAEAWSVVGAVDDNTVTRAKHEDMKRELEGQVQACREQISSMSKDKEAMGKDIDDLHEERFAMRRSIADARADSTSMRRDLERLRDMNHFLRKSHGNGEVRRLKGINDRLWAEKEAQKKKLDKSEDDVKKWRADTVMYSAAYNALIAKR